MCSDVTDTVMARTPSPAKLLPAPSMMLPISLAVLSLVFPARAEVPALYTVHQLGGFCGKIGCKIGCKIGSVTRFYTRF